MDIKEPLSLVLLDFNDLGSVHSSHTLGQIITFCENYIAENQDVKTREASFYYILLASILTHLHKIGEARRVLSELELRFGAIYPEVLRFKTLLEVDLCFLQVDLSGASDKIAALAVDSSTIRIRHRMEAIRYCKQARLLILSGTPVQALLKLEKAERKLQSEESQRVELVLRSCIYLLRGQVYNKIGNFEEALVNYGRAVTLTNHIEYHIGLMRGLCGKGRVLTKLRKLPEASQCLQQALELSKKLESAYDSMCSILNLGQVHFVSRRYSNAMNCYNEAWMYSQSADCLTEQAEINSRLGDVLMIEGRYTQAAESFEADLRYSKDSKNKAALAHALRNIGRFKRFMGEFEEAESHLVESSQLFKELGDHYNMGQVYIPLCVCYANMGKINKATEAVQEFKKTEAAVGATSPKGLMPLLRGIIANSEGKVEEAKHYLETALTLFSQAPSPYTVYNMLELAKLHEGCSDAGKSVDYGVQAVYMARTLHLTYLEKTALTYVARLDRSTWMKLLRDSDKEMLSEVVMERPFAAVLMCQLRLGPEFMSLKEEDISSYINKYFDCTASFLESKGAMLSHLVGTRFVAFFVLGSGLSVENVVEYADKIVKDFSELTPVPGWSDGATGLVVSLTCGEVIGGLLGPIGKSEYTFFGAPVQKAHTLLEEASFGEPNIDPAIALSCKKEGPNSQATLF